jgi:hypothetical protein
MCQQSKLNAMGKLQDCLKKHRAKVLLGSIDNAATCEAKFKASLTKADDRAFNAGTSCRYLDNGDMTVTDLNTGLVWEQKDNSGGIHDKDNLYSWSATPTTGTDPDGTLFVTFLGTLNSGTSLLGDTSSGCFAGHCDWHIPTVEEVQGILLHPFPCSSPCFDPVLGGVPNDYWTSTTSTNGGPTSAWVVIFQDGHVVDTDIKGSTTGYARAVRGGF